MDSVCVKVVGRDGYLFEAHHSVVLTGEVSVCLRMFFGVLNTDSVRVSFSQREDHSNGWRSCPAMRGSFARSCVPKGPPMRGDDEVRDDRITLAATAEMDGVCWRTSPSWPNPAGSQGGSHRTLGSFDTRRLNPALNAEGGNHNYPLH
jgi:hypothetical protein